MFGKFVRSVSRKNFSTAVPLQRNGKALLGLAAAGVAGLVAFYLNSKEASAFGYIEECLHPPHYEWEHNKLWKSYDHGAIRRGFQVYNTIGAACHSMKFRFYRQLVDVAFTEEEAKALAAEHDDYPTEPDEEGDIGERIGTLTDRFWSPYKNDKQARAMNKGALPPDLSMMVRSRHGGESYILALLTGYRDPPAGVKLAENMYYNIYFPGCQIAMPPPLAEGAVEYEDGTESSISQMSKDVSVYLAWSSYMEHDERHLMGLKTLACLGFIAFPFLYWKKFRFSYLKTRKVDFLRRNPDAEPPPKH